MLEYVILTGWTHIHGPRGGEHPGDPENLLDYEGNFIRNHWPSRQPVMRHSQLPTSLFILILIAFSLCRGGPGCAHLGWSILRGQETVGGSQLSLSSSVASTLTHLLSSLPSNFHLIKQTNFWNYFFNETIISSLNFQEKISFGPWGYVTTDTQCFL